MHTEQGLRYSPASDRELAAHAKPARVKMTACRQSESCSISILQASNVAIPVRFDGHDIPVLSREAAMERINQTYRDKELVSCRAQEPLL